MRNVSSGQRPLRDLVLAHECDAFPVLRIPNEVLKKLHTSGITRDPIMRADRHHPSASGGFRVEDFEIVLQILQVGDVRRGGRFKANDVVVANSVWNDGEWFSVNGHGKRLIAADIVNVIDKTQLLQNA